jgi:hypothetical protein
MLDLYVWIQTQRYCLIERRRIILVTGRRESFGDGSGTAGGEYKQLTGDGDVVESYLSWRSDRTYVVLGGRDVRNLAFCVSTL